MNSDFYPRKPSTNQPPARPTSPQAASAGLRSVPPPPSYAQPQTPPQRPVMDGGLPPVPPQIPSTDPMPSFDQSDKATKKPRSKWRALLCVLLALLALVIAGLIAGFICYQQALSPVDADAKTKQRLTIAAGTTPRQIAKQLEAAHLVRSETAFYLYLLQTGSRDNLQAGVYVLSAADSTQSIVESLKKGSVDEVKITFYPGGVLDKGPKDAQKTSVTEALKKAGYNDSEIAAALKADYNAPTLFSGKPADTDLEGYVYGDTYNALMGAPAKAVIQKSLDEFTDVVTRNNLINAYKAQGLTLYQGITLASIIQRELSTTSKTPTEDQRIVAQIFLTRLKENMPLGSDVTYQYGAAQLGVAPTPTLDSPYNTRIHQGLPPGPIASPGLGALLALAHPADTKYLYFLSGDDDKTYFATTQEQHEANAAAHCQKKCSEN